MKFHILRSGNEFYWRLVARNNQIVATPGERYKRKSTLKKMLKKINPNFEIVDLSDK